LYFSNLLKCHVAIGHEKQGYCIDMARSLINFPKRANSRDVSITKTFGEWSFS